MLSEKVITEETRKFLEQIEKKQLRELKSKEKPFFEDRHLKVKYYEDVGEAREKNRLMRKAYCFLLHTAGKTYKEVGEIIGIHTQLAANESTHFKHMIDSYEAKLKASELDKGKGFVPTPDKKHRYYTKGHPFS